MLSCHGNPILNIKPVEHCKIYTRQIEHHVEISSTAQWSKIIYFALVWYQLPYRRCVGCRCVDQVKIKYASKYVELPGVTRSNKYCIVVFSYPGGHPNLNLMRVCSFFKPQGSYYTD